MNNAEIRKKVFEIVSDIMETPVDQINEGSSSNNLPNWDSMTQMSLTLALQEEFQVKLPSAQAIGLSNVKLILSTLEDLLKSR